MPRQSARAAPARAPPAPAARAPPAATPVARAPPAATPVARAPPAPAPAMQSAQPAGGGMLASLGSTMASGMAFGAGSAVANQAVGAIFNSMSGGKESAPQAPAPAVPKAAGPCDTDRTSLNQCLSSSNASNCDFYFTALQNCQSNSV